ncbi:MAG: amidohydrolase [Clostridia bacterium]
MKEYILKGCTLISMDKCRKKVQENIDIWIKEDKIYKIDFNLSKKGIKTYNLKGKVVMPGLVNAHNHMPMSIFRETVDGYTLQSWLSQKMWPLEAKLTEEDIYTGTLLSCLECIKTGTTTVNNMYFAAKSETPAIEKCKIRAVQTQNLLDANGKGKENIELFKQMLKNKTDSPRITYSLGVHGFYTNSPKYLNEVNKLNPKKELPVHIHFCENDQEVEDICKMHKVESPVDLLEKYYAEDKLILAHCVKLDSSEILRLSKLTKASVVFNPVSNLRLGCGVAKIREMQTCGINICLGTDGQASGSSLDMFESMKIAALIIKGYYKDPLLMPAYEVIKMATINGAKALNLDEKIGSIEVGKQADIIAIDLNNITTSPINDILSELVYNVKGENVQMTIVDGEILYIKKEYLILDDEKEIILKAKEIMERIK